MSELNFQRRIELMKLMIELRQTIPMGIVGLLETRNLLAVLFPEFADVRDHELDEAITNYATSIARQPDGVPRDPGKPEQRG